MLPFEWYNSGKPESHRRAAGLGRDVTSGQVSVQYRQNNPVENQLKTQAKDRLASACFPLCGRGTTAAE